MTKQEYQEYLKSDDWDLIRRFRLSEDRYSCQRCGAKNKLQVHHLTYERVGDEYVEDLITLCRDCHEWIEQQKILSGGLSKYEQLKIIKKEVNQMFYVGDLVGIGGSSKGRNTNFKGVRITHNKNSSRNDVRISLGEDALIELKQPENISVLYGIAWENRLFIMNSKDCEGAVNARPYKCSKASKSAKTNSVVRIPFKYFQEAGKPVPSEGIYTLCLDDKGRPFIKIK